MTRSVILCDIKLHANYAMMIADKLRSLKGADGGT